MNFLAEGQSYITFGGYERSSELKWLDVVEGDNAHWKVKLT